MAVRGRLLKMQITRFVALSSTFPWILFGAEYPVNDFPVVLRMWKDSDDALLYLLVAKSKIIIYYCIYANRIPSICWHRFREGKLQCTYTGIIPCRHALGQKPVTNLSHARHASQSIIPCLCDFAYHLLRVLKNVFCKVAVTPQEVLLSALNPFKSVLN